MLSILWRNWAVYETMTKLELTIELKPFTPNSDFTVVCDLKIVHKTIDVQYRVSGDLENLFIPDTKAQPQRMNRLWETTCFELFVAEVGKKEYSEVNVSPSGDWNVYTFSDYRAGMVPNNDFSGIKFSTTQNLTELNVGFSVDSKISKPSLGISAVLKLNSGEITYWANRHIRDRPDFHLRENFLDMA